MAKRLTALAYPPYIKTVRNTLICLITLFSFSLFSQGTEDLKKQADKLFKEEQYSEAYKLYSQLVSNYPKDPEYNFRLGVCMIYSEPDKKKSIAYLKVAAAAGEDAPKETPFYLGKAYHINYRFDDAIKLYTQFKQTAPAALQKKLEVDREIKACVNGKHLLSNLTDLEVLNKKELPESDYFRSYDLRQMNGKLLVKPDDFRSSADKKKKEKSVVFLPTGSDIVYYSSYGDKSETGRDIYTITKSPNGKYGKPQKVNGINTEFDEDYPFLHPDGKTLYFASKGHNSMGGYDIFKSFYNEATNSWSAPQNLEFPINSPDDDFLFVTDSAESTAFFSTGRQSPPGKIDVLKVKTKRRAIDIVAVKGSVLKGQVDHSLASIIQVKDLFTDQDLGTFEADESGNYMLELPNAGKMVFTVETPGMETQSAQVSLPANESLKPYRQTISYNEGKLKILNYFDEPVTDNSYLSYLNVIEKKAKLEVNSTEENQSEEKAPVTEEKKQTTPQLIAEEPGLALTPEKETPPAVNNKKNLSNKELAAIAKKDAIESRTEAAQLQRDAKDAIETGQRKKSEAEKKITETDQVIADAEKIDNEDEKKKVIAQATEEKKAAEIDRTVAEKILAFGESLSEDAKLKEREASLNEQYSSELQKAVNSKNTASLEKLAQLQQEIDSLAGRRMDSDLHVADVQEQISQKEKQIATSEESTASIRSNLAEIKTTISEKEEELAQTKKKKLKTEINEQINDLRNEQTEKENQIAAGEAESKRLTGELSGLKNELEITSKISTENLSPMSLIPAEKLSVSELKSKYADKITADRSDKVSLEKTVTELNNYNQDIETVLARSKGDLKTAKDPNAKKRLTTEIKQLENLKKENQVLISSNFNRITELNKIEEQNKPIVENHATFRPIAAESPTQALVLLDELKEDLEENRRTIASVMYLNPQAQAIKFGSEDDLKIIEERQQKLLEDIRTSSEIIKTIDTKTVEPVKTAEGLLKEAEELTTEAQNKRSESRTAEGDAKQKLIAAAKAFEEEANDKNIQAAEITKRDNAIIVATNKENIQNILKLKKASDEDGATVSKLNEEAAAAYRKAQEIRGEGNSLTSKGARLGNYSNAEEQEAEAILKQQQALDLLLRTAPEFVLKPIVTSTTAAAEAAAKPKGPDLDSSLVAVNKGIEELADLRLQSTIKFYEANDAELQQLFSDAKENETFLEKDPSLKRELEQGIVKQDNARTYRNKSEDAKTNNDKINLLNTAIRQQQLAIEQLTNLNISLEKLAAAPPPSPPTPTVAVQTPVEKKTEVSEPVFTDTVVATETVATLPNNPETSTTTAVEPTETVAAIPEPTTAPIDTKTVDINAVAQRDTTTEDIIHFFDSNEPLLQNQEANTALSASISRLKDFEALSRALKDSVAQSTGEETPQEVVVDPVALRKSADQLLAESDALMEESEDAREEAKRLKGEDKKTVQQESKELEERAQSRMFESAALMQKANEAEYKSNIAAIDELMGRLSADDSDLAAELTEQRKTFQPLKSQIANLRNDAATMTNPSAKLGAIGNAEEKEAELIRKQNEMLVTLKRKYPDYVAKPITSPGAGSNANLLQRQTQVREGQYSELGKIANAFSQEFETSKAQLPENLAPENETLKKNALDLNAESKRLLVESASEIDPDKKLKLLTASAKTGNAAVEQLNKLIPGRAVVARSTPPPAEETKPTEEPVANNDIKQLEDIGNRINTDEEPLILSPEVKPEVNIETKVSSPPVKGNLKVAGIAIVKGNAYTPKKPIPVDAKIEDGLIFRVQIGAFRSKIPDNAFKGLSPLNGETTPTGYIRYTAGNFDKIESANAVKNDLRGLGYSDAFVVAYLNGKRISLGAAMDQLRDKGIEIDPNAPQTAGITTNLNVPKATANTGLQEMVTVTKELERINGMLYTIQIGVFNKEVTKTQLRGLRPIYSEQLNNGLYRYTAGIYSDPDKLIADKTKVVELGVKDAFISAYLNGKRISFAEAKGLQVADTTLRMESENPIVFPGPTVLANEPQTMRADDSPFPEATVTPFTNNILEYPEPTADNGVKTNEAGISYKVQIGAYSKEVPDEVAEKFSAIKNWPVENKQINSLFVYNVGNFSDVKFAKQLRDEVKGLGINDAFVTVYRDGKKLYGDDAAALLR